MAAAENDNLLDINEDSESELSIFTLFYYIMFIMHMLLLVVSLEFTDLQSIGRFSMCLLIYHVSLNIFCI